MKVFVAVVLLGFPIALILAWALTHYRFVRSRKKPRNLGLSDALRFTNLGEQSPRRPGLLATSLNFPISNVL